MSDFSPNHLPRPPRPRPPQGPLGSSQYEDEYDRVNDDDPLSGVLADFADQIEGLKGDELAAYDNLEFYAEYVMGYDNPSQAPPSSFLRRIYHELQYSDETDFIILGPRESAKSQAVSVNYTTWKIGRNPLIRFLMCFASKEAQGYPFSKQLAGVIERNERYKAIFGELHSPRSKNRWTDDERTVDRQEPPGGMKDATISIVALGSAVPSKRAEELIVDDIVTQENAHSNVLQDKIEAFLFTSLFPILTPRSRRIILGTRWDMRDLYGRLFERWRIKVPQPDPSVNLDSIIDELVRLQEERDKNAVVMETE